MWAAALPRICEANSLGSTNPPPAWEHEVDVDVMPSQQGRETLEPQADEWSLFFDGGCRVLQGARKGSGGWLLCSPDGLVKAG